MTLKLNSYWLDRGMYIIWAINHFLIDLSPTPHKMEPRSGASNLAIAGQVIGSKGEQNQVLLFW